MWRSAWLWGARAEPVGVAWPPAGGAGGFRGHAPGALAQKCRLFFPLSAQSCATLFSPPLNIEHLENPTGSRRSDTAIARAIATFHSAIRSQPIVIAKNAMVMSVAHRPPWPGEQRFLHQGSMARLQHVVIAVVAGVVSTYVPSCGVSSSTSRTAVSSFTPYADCEWWR